MQRLIATEDCTDKAHSHELVTCGVLSDVNESLCNKGKTKTWAHKTKTWDHKTETCGKA